MPVEITRSQIRSLTAAARYFAAGIAVFLAHAANADVLLGTNGERFVGTVVEETPSAVIFKSELGGQITIPRAQIQEIQKKAPPPKALPTTRPITTANWLPPGVGFDGFDWLQLTSGEWLKGHLNYVQERKVSFESDKLDDLTLKLKNVSGLFTAEPVQTRFEGTQRVPGKVAMDKDIVHIDGPEQVSLPRSDLLGITPGGEAWLDTWSGKFVLGYALQSGNTNAQSLNVNAELDRRLPSQALELSYLGDYNEVNNSIDQNDHRVAGLYDVRLNQDWFVRVAQLEYYRDPPSNIDDRVTGNLGIGYNFYNGDDLTWYVLAGPAYQYTQFVSVEDDEPHYAQTPAGVFASVLKADLTSRTNLKLAYEGIFTDERAGRYSHHAVSTLEFKITHVVVLDLSLIWDFLDHPQARANGNIPDNTDLRLNVGVGLQF
jgi:hypothetical protein